jgi:hypothetical protein
VAQTESPAARRGFPSSYCSASAVLLTRLAAALPGAVELLLLLLAGMLLTALLLLARFGLLAGLLALLLAGVSVGFLILTHIIYFLPTLAFRCSPPVRRNNARAPIRFRLANAGKLVGTQRRLAGSHWHVGDDNQRGTHHGTLSIALAVGDSAADPAVDLAVRRIALALLWQI